MSKSTVTLIIIWSAIASIFSFLFDVDSLLIPFLFLISQAFLGVLLINVENEAFYPQDIRVLFIVTYSLYSLFCPLISLLGFDVFLSTMPLTTFCFGLGMTGFNLGNILFPVKWVNISLIKNSVNYSLLLLLLLAELIVLTVYLIAYHVPVFTTLGQFDRFEFFATINQVWVVLTMAISLTSCLIIYYFDERNKKQFLFGILLIVYYIALQLSLGNRRDFLPILLFSTSYFLTKYRSKLNVKVVIIGAVLFIGSFWLVQQRNNNLEYSRVGAVQESFVDNEFVYPMQTLAYVIDDKWDLRYGYTYFILPFQVAIPRYFYPDKPDDLGKEFVNETFGEGSQGYAYTPVTEAYLNFGILGSLFVFLLFALFLSQLVRRFNSYSISFVYFLLYSFVFDFCRGTFATVIYQVFVSLLFYFIIDKLIKKAPSYNQ
ncbi:MAG: oligosaccharide repeat unit polymerase [Paludibacter sp.]|nr:oligosaccharide repeat unit polymerase [Paludibacter sp.]